MAVRFRSTRLSSLNTSWRVDIDDADHVGGITNMDIVGPVLKYRGENQERHSPFLTSEVAFTMKIVDAGMEAWIEDLATSEEGRFTVGVYISGTLEWAGVILPDIARLEDIYYPYDFEVSASDGLGLLRTIAYKDTAGPYTGDTRLINYIANCLKKIPHVPQYWTGGNFLRSTVDWYEAGMATGINDDPLWQTFDDARNWFDYGTDGVEKYRSCYEVLKIILETFGARLFQTRGKWWVEQVEVRALEADVLTRTYVYDMTAPASVNTLTMVQVGAGFGYKKLRGGHFSFMPAMKRVQVNYDAKERNNYSSHKQYSSTASVYDVTLGTIDSNSGAARLRLVGLIAASAFSANPVSGQVPRAFVFRAKIKVGDKYLKRAYTIVNYQATYGDMEWTTDENYVYIVTSYITFDPANISGYLNYTVDVISPPLSSDGPLVFNFTYEFLMNNEGGPSSGYTVTWQFGPMFLELWQNGMPQLTAIGKRYAVENTLASTATYEINTIMGDGPTSNAIGRLKYWNGTDYVNTSLWGPSAGPRDRPLTELLAERIMRGQTTARRRMHATITGTYFPLYARVEYQGKYYQFVGGEYSTPMDEWAGEWLEILYDELTPLNTIDVQQITGDYTAGGSTSTVTTTTTTVGGGTDHTALAPLAVTTLAASLAAGAVTSITVADALAENAFVAGQIIVVKNPTNGQYAQLTVTANTAAGATTVAVSGSAPGVLPVGSYVINTPKNDLLAGGVNAAEKQIKVTALSVTSSGTMAIPAKTRLINIIAKANAAVRTIKVGTTAGANNILELTTLASGESLNYPTSYYFESAGTLYFTVTGATIDFVIETITL